jgi:hypothetical protein
MRGRSLVVPPSRCSVDSIGSEKSALLIDEQWFQQWVAFGMLEIAVYLTHHAAFLNYCEHRDKRRKRGSL